MIDLAILTRTDEYLDRLAASLFESHQDWGDRQLIVGDNGLSPACRERHPRFTYVPIAEPFNFSRAVNTVVAAMKPEHDIVVMNDDTKILSKDFPLRVEEALTVAKLQGYGLISPRIRGGVGNAEQTYTSNYLDIRRTKYPVCFVCAIIPRQTWAEVGGLDERFDQYGFEDADYSRRVVDTGKSLGVAGWIEIEHRHLGHCQSGTFPRVYGEQRHADMGQEAWKIFKAKWGEGPQLGDYERSV